MKSHFTEICVFENWQIFDATHTREKLTAENSRVSSKFCQSFGARCLHQNFASLSGPGAFIKILSVFRGPVPLPKIRTGQINAKRAKITEFDAHLLYDMAGSPARKRTRGGTSGSNRGPASRTTGRRTRGGTGGSNRGPASRTTAPLANEICNLKFQILVPKILKKNYRPKNFLSTSGHFSLPFLKGRGG